MDTIRALQLLDECTGHDVWSLEHCRRQGVPESWIAELADGHESGFRDDRETLYVNHRPVNQYEGIHDLQLAIKLAAYLGIEVERYIRSIAERGRLVVALKEAVEEG